MDTSFLELLFEVLSDLRKLEREKAVEERISSGSMVNCPWLSWVNSESFTLTLTLYANKGESEYEGRNFMKGWKSFHSRNDSREEGKEGKFAPGYENIRTYCSTLVYRTLEWKRSDRYPFIRVRISTSYTSLFHYSLHSLLMYSSIGIAEECLGRNGWFKSREGCKSIHRAGAVC